MNEKETEQVATTTETEASAKSKAAKAPKEKKPNIFVRMGKRIGKFFRDYGSEMKKVVWMPAKLVRKNTALVVIVVIIVGAVIGLLDYAFSQAIYAIGRLI